MAPLPGFDRHRGRAVLPGHLADRPRDERLGRDRALGQRERP